VPEAKVEDPLIQSTEENLAVALKGEIYERDEMYPLFIRQAESEGNTAAVRTLKFAHAAEIEHARLYTAALQNLETMTERRVYYVCPVCGYTSATDRFDFCPTSGTPRERFEQVK
jgi:rubrerythrin